MGKNFTIFSDNLKMNTAPMPATPGYAEGGIVLGDDMMQLMERRPATVSEALVRKASEEARRREVKAQAEKDDNKRRRNSEL